MTKPLGQNSGPALEKPSRSGPCVLALLWITRAKTPTDGRSHHTGELMGFLSGVCFPPSRRVRLLVSAEVDGGQCSSFHTYATKQHTQALALITVPAANNAA